VKTKAKDDTHNYFRVLFKSAEISAPFPLTACYELLI